LHRPDLGFVDIVLPWLSIIATIALFWPIHVGAALLLLPYLAWVTFATGLNLAVWRLNPLAGSTDRIVVEGAKRANSPKIDG
jgi:tryptophan-rich sensory protein